MTRLKEACSKTHLCTYHPNIPTIYPAPRVRCPQSTTRILVSQRAFGRLALTFCKWTKACFAASCSASFFLLKASTVAAAQIQRQIRGNPVGTEIRGENVTETVGKRKQSRAGTNPKKQTDTHTHTEACIIFSKLNYTWPAWRMYISDVC